MMHHRRQGLYSSQQMDFFNKYKNLFEVPQGLGLPPSRLTLDNDLFIEKTYVPTKTQEYSLNGKLRELKRDYTQFEQSIDELTKMRLTPKRSQSRKGKDPSRPSTLPSISNQNRQTSPQLLKISQPPRPDLQQEKQLLLRDMMKRQGWLKDQQSNILKHSQMDHIFTNKLNNVYDLDEIKPSTLPRPDRGDEYESKKQKQAFSIKQRSKPHLESKSQRERGGGEKNPDDARARREKANSTLQFRRKKLEQLLRTLW